MANNTDGNDAAFARPSDGIYLMANGLTKREYFAAIAMQAMLANPYWNDCKGSEVADMSVTMADHLIFQLNERSSEKMV